MWPLADCISSILVQTPSLQLGVLQSLQGSLHPSPILLFLPCSLTPLVGSRESKHKSTTIYQTAQVGHKRVNPFTIILLKDDVRRIKNIMRQGIEQFILQKVKVKIIIHPAINLGSIPNPLRSHTPSNHDPPSSKLDCSLYQPVTQPLSWLFPHPVVFI